jgi:Cu/Ag efflux protein CusF
MRRALVLLTAALMVLSLSSLALAQGQTTPPTTAAPPTTTTPPAAKPATKAAGVKHMTGEVTSVNADTKSFTVKHTGKKKAKPLTFTLGADATGQVTDYKPGDSVRVSYVDEAGKLVAQSVTKAKPAEKKKK